MTTLTEIAQNAACDAVVDLLDGGTIELQTSVGAEVATIQLGNPAFGAASSGTASMNSATRDSNATGGLATKAVFKDSLGSEVFQVTVGSDGDGTDLEFPSNDFTAGEEVNVTSYDHTQPA